MSSFPDDFRSSTPGGPFAPCVPNLALALHAIADRLDTSPPGAFSASVWPLSTTCSAIARLGAVADRIRERADAGEADDRDRACLDAALAQLLSAIENMEACA